MHRLRMALTLVGLLTLACSRDSHGPDQASGAKEKLVRVEATLDTNFFPADETRTTIARVRIAPEPRPERGRPPVNLALVVDTSGSMEGRAIEDAKKASKALVDALKDGDRLAVVSFDSSATVLVESTELDSDARSEMKRKLAAMRARGTTDMEGGLRQGLAQVSAHRNPQGINRIVLLGDGIPNEETAIRAIAESARSSGVSVTALGLGADYNEALMGEIAQISGGKFHYVEDSAKVLGFLGNEVLRMDGVYARNAELELVPGPGVAIEKIIGQRASVEGRRIRLPLGDLSRGEQRELFVRMNVGEHHAGASIELCDAVLRYDAPGGHRTEERLFLSARSTNDEKALAQSKNFDIELGAAFAQAAAATVEAIELARAGQKPLAIKLLSVTADEIDRIAKHHGNKKLADEAEALRGLRSDLPPPSAPQPAPAAEAIELDEHSGRKAMSRESGERLRRKHDSAMQALQ
jgi:Ca-activated chloride channel family protein